jgi:hypothetical protein
LAKASSGGGMPSPRVEKPSSASRLDRPSAVTAAMRSSMFWSIAAQGSAPLSGACSAPSMTCSMPPVLPVSTQR